MYRLRSSMGMMIARRTVLVAASLFLAACRGLTDPREQEYWSQYPWEWLEVDGSAPQLAAFLVRSPYDAGRPGLKRLMIVMSNPTAKPVSLRFGACTFGLRLYQSPEYFLPSWDNRGDSCDLIAYLLTLSPGQTVSWPADAEVWPIGLADSLPAGRYYAAVTWRRSASAPVQIVPAGTIVIGRAP